MEQPPPPAVRIIAYLLSAEAVAPVASHRAHCRLRERLEGLRLDEREVMRLVGHAFGGDQPAIAHLETIAGHPLLRLRAAAGGERRARSRHHPARGARVRIDVLSLAISVDGRDVPLQNRERELVIALALAPGGIEREFFAEQIWPDNDRAHTRNRLKVYVSRLRRMLGETAIVSSRRTIALGADVAVDLRDLEDILQGGARTADDHATLAQAARTSLDQLGAGTRGWEWIGPHVPRLERIVRLCALAAAKSALAQDRHVEALALAESLCDEDPDDSPARELALRARRNIEAAFG